MAFSKQYFENYRYQEDLFPTSRFRMAYDALQESTPSRASKEYLKILKLAAETGEVPVDQALRELLAGEEEVAITVEAVGAVLAQLDTIAPVTMVEVALVDLASWQGSASGGAPFFLLEPFFGAVASGAKVRISRNRLRRQSF